MESDCMLSGRAPNNKYIINQNLQNVDDVCVRELFVRVLVLDNERVSPLQNNTYVPTVAISF